MKYPLYIAKRYLFSKSNKNAVNIISRIAVFAVIIGSMALFIVLSGFAGLKDFALEFTNVFDSDLKITPATGKTLSISEVQKEQINKIDGVVSFAEIVEERVFIQYDGKNHIAFIKGVGSNFTQVTPIDSLLFVGDWMEPGQEEVVAGYGIATKLSLPARDYGNLIELYVPKPGTGQLNVLDPSSAFSKKLVVASGIYEVNEDLNSKYIFSDISMARELLALDSSLVSSLEFKLDPLVDEAKIVAEIRPIFSEEIQVKNRIQQNDALYKMLNSENLFTYLFVSLIAAIAIFNIAGTIIMVILEKRRNIKTLYFLGLTIPEIRNIFFYNGLLMTFIGLCIGLVLGSIAVLLQMRYGWVPITPSLPYPVSFNLVNLLLVFVTIFGLGGVASKIASMRVTSKLLA